MTTKLHLGVGGYCGAELFRVRCVECVPLILPPLNNRACVTALQFELAWRRDRGEVIPPGVAEVVLADIEDAAEHGDQDRLAWLWRCTPSLVGELLEHVAEGRQLPI